MKKIDYKKPEIKVMSLFSEQMLTTCSGEVDGNHEFDYGGSDDDGELVPNAKRGIWDDNFNDD